MKKIILCLVLIINSTPLLADNLSDSNALFDWAERNYPEYFSPVGMQTIQIDIYYARYYSDTKIYLATSGEDVYVYGEIFGGLLLVGKISDFITTASTTTGTIITVGTYRIESDGSYTDLNKNLIFSVGANCETWSRTTAGDDVNPDSHLHYNAHNGSTYVNGIFTWFEYGPEHSQSDIEATCAAPGAVGVEKAVNNTDYYQDKANLYLKITQVQ